MINKRNIAGKTGYTIAIKRAGLVLARTPWKWELSCQRYKKTLLWGITLFGFCICGWINYGTRP